MSRKWLLVAALSCALTLGVAACGNDDEGGSADGGGSSVSGSITIDGSSTVFPFAQAAGELFRRDNPGVRVTVGESGTGGGFEKFCAGETDISDASRAIEEEEVDACKKGKVAYEELRVANDGIAVAANPALEVDCLTTDQLKQVWSKDSTVKSLRDVDSKLPDGELSLFGPGTDSGTFDFFTEAINGEEGDTRKDYQPSEDDNVLVEGVSGDEGGFGYFGFSYYEQNQDKLKLVGVDAGDGCVEPSKETIQDGSYKPLARPLYMYPSAEALEKPAVKAFLDFVISDNEAIAEAANIVALTPEQAHKAKEGLDKLAR